MARPRIFISSTYFDLKNVRADLEYFVRERGYDPVLHERGSVPYGKSEALERYCYKEIESCDILVSIVGGRFGSGAEDSSYSISQVELKVALELSKQVYVFVEREVYHEYKTYEKNKDSKINWSSVDSVKIFNFLDEIYSLKSNNPVQPFETSFDITSNLKEQWAGLFQRFLSQSSAEAHSNMFLDLRQSLETARSLTEIIAAQAEHKDDIVSDLVLTNHPVFSAIRKSMNIPYRLLFYDLDEFTKWIEARGYKREVFEFDDLKFEWYNIDKAQSTVATLYINRDLFDDEGKLKPISHQNWSDDYVKHTITNIKKPTGTSNSELEDDIPF
jgi:hypothetical protein